MVKKKWAICFTKNILTLDPCYVLPALKNPLFLSFELTSYKKKSYFVSCCNLVQTTAHTNKPISIFNLKSFNGFDLCGDFCEAQITV